MREKFFFSFLKESTFEFFSVFVLHACVWMEKILIRYQLRYILYHFKANVLYFKVQLDNKNNMTLELRNQYHSRPAASGIIAPV